jgi:hypothetical protein
MLLEHLGIDKTLRHVPLEETLDQIRRRRVGILR